MYAKDTKSGKGRQVAIHAALVERLREHWQASAHAAPTDWMCAHVDERHLTPGYNSRYFSEWAGRLNLSMTLHFLRHTPATMLIAAGVPVVAVSERLGHADVTITQNLYTHVLLTMRRQAAEIVDRDQTGSGY